MPFHLPSIRSPRECVETVLRDLKGHLELGLCSECAITMVAVKRKMTRGAVSRVWLNNLDQVPVEDAKKIEWE